jgi:hypothetical protein
MTGRRIAAIGIAVMTFVVFAGVPEASARLAPYRWQQTRVYVENHASARWQVPAATQLWSAGVKNFVLINGRCRPNAPCIKVYEGRYGDTGWIGVTQIAYRGRYIVGTVTIKLNATYSWYTARSRRAVACHEIGHAIGAAHNGNYRGSCMYDPAWRYPYPSKQDMAELTARYAR